MSFMVFKMLIQRCVVDVMRGFEVWGACKPVRRRMMKKRGFTMAEIMVVVAVISLLMGLGTLTVRKGIRNSRIKRAKTELAMLSTAVLQLAWDTGRWPNGTSRTDAGGSEVWDLSSRSCGLLGTDGSYNNWKGPYYDGALSDPWGNSYFFSPNFRGHVVVGSLGPNGRESSSRGGNDDVFVVLDH